MRLHQGPVASPRRTRLGNRLWRSGKSLEVPPSERGGAACGRGEYCVRATPYEVLHQSASPTAPSRRGRGHCPSMPPIGNDNSTSPSERGVAACGRGEYCGQDHAVRSTPPAGFADSPLSEGAVTADCKRVWTRDTSLHCGAGRHFIRVAGAHFIARPRRAPSLRR